MFIHQFMYSFQNIYLAIIQKTKKNKNKGKNNRKEEWMGKEEEKNMERKLSGRAREEQFAVTFI